MTPELDETALSRLDAARLLELGALPLRDGSLAFAGPADLEAAEWIAHRLEREPLPVQEGLGEGLDRLLAAVRGRLASRPVEDLLSLEEEALGLGEDGSLEDVRRRSQAEPLVRLVDHILEEAVEQGATDIHVEPGEEGTSVRLRRDGMLREHLLLPPWVQLPLVSRLKILASLDIAEKRLPQDGRIALRLGGKEVDVRASTLPVRLGEKVVLRLLRQDRKAPELSETGMPEDLRRRFEALCDRPQGLIAVTGPTGSGKTSTLFAALHRLLPRAINISTIEDPIEYRLKGANQVQVHEKAGLGFPEALRSLLRQDPDVILVGEIRDGETAQIALQAAQTGHLVFTTLHTNDAAGAVTRLVDLGIPPFLVGSALLGVLAQRLVRRLCPHCRRTRPSSPEERELLQEAGLPAGSVHEAVGCPRCEGTGYRGRTGVFELLVPDDALRERIGSGLSEGQIRTAAGFAPLRLDGLEKAARGETTLDEVLRVALR